MTAPAAPAAVLLLDLDGVVVFEAVPPLWATRELILLHRDLAALLDAEDIGVAVLTHRSRREAERILAAAGIGGRPDVRVFAAEDLFAAARRAGGWRALWRGGLLKSGVVPEVERHFGVERKNIAFVDDRMDNLQDLLAAGIGLALHAPSEHTGAGTLTAFSLREALELVAAWQRGDLAERLVALPPHVAAIEGWQRTGLHTASEARHPFNALRRVGRFARHTAKRLAR
jgi:hypothetical protein